MVNRNRHWMRVFPFEPLLPNTRVLPILDALSLLIAFGGRQEETLRDVPRGGWDDRVIMSWRPIADRRIECARFPFERAPQVEAPLPTKPLPPTAAHENHGR